MLGNQEDAQDAAQEAFLKCWRNQGSLKDVQNMRAWIFRVALNVARDQQRKSAWYRRSKQFNGEDYPDFLNAGPDPKMDDRKTGIPRSGSHRDHAPATG